MADSPNIRFLSLFVPDLNIARQQYQVVFGIEPSTSRQPPNPHPFANTAPVVFELGTICVALYQADGKGTHPGDVGIGIEVADPAAVAQRAARAGGRVFYGPKGLPTDGRLMTVFVLPDRHFFEVVDAGCAPDK